MGVEFRLAIYNPAAKNWCMPSLMPSSTAGPMRPATTMEAGLVIVFEGVLDATSKVNATFQSCGLRCVPIYILLCMYQGE